MWIHQAHIVMSSSQLRMGFELGLVLCVGLELGLAGVKISHMSSGIERVHWGCPFDFMIKLTMRRHVLSLFPREHIEEILIHFGDYFGEEFSLIHGQRLRV